MAAADRVRSDAAYEKNRADLLGKELTAIQLNLHSCGTFGQTVQTMNGIMERWLLKYNSRCSTIDQAQAACGELCSSLASTLVSCGQRP